MFNTTPETIEFKYAIASWDYPESSAIEWEVGKHNRAIQPEINKNAIICGTYGENVRKYVEYGQNNSKSID